MQKELYQIERSEVSLNISEGAVTEVRRKHIVRSGCRVYDGGKLGISGVFGEPDEATWQAAQRALTAGLSHPEPLGALVRSRETGVMPEERELLEQSEALLAHLREECPGFVFSNKIVALSERVGLENDLGRRLDDRQSGSFLNLVVKDEASPNVFDTGIGWTSRGNAAIDGLEAARRSLRAYRNEVPMPKEKLPVLFAGSFLSGKLEGLLDVQKLESGASLFSGKMPAGLQHSINFPEAPGQVRPEIDGLKGCNGVKPVVRKHHIRHTALQDGAAPLRDDGFVDLFGFLHADGGIVNALDDTLWAFFQ